MPAGRPLRPNDPSVITNLETALTPTRRPGPIDIAWHWRWEIGATATLVVVTAMIAISLGSTGLIVAAGAGLAALCTMMCWPPARARIVARVRCVITRHRIRKGCANAWVQTRGGNLPIVMSCSPADYGERVRLWLPAGLTADDLMVAREAGRGAGGVGRRQRPLRMRCARYSLFLNRLSNAARASLAFRGAAILGAGTEFPFECP